MKNNTSRSATPVQKVAQHKTEPGPSSSEPGQDRNQLDYHLEVRWTDHGTDTDYHIMLQRQSGLTKIVAHSKAERISESGVSYCGTLDAEDLQRLVEICLDAAEHAHHLTEEGGEP